MKVAEVSWKLLVTCIRELNKNVDQIHAKFKISSSVNFLI